MLVGVKIHTEKSHGLRKKPPGHSYQGSGVTGMIKLPLKLLEGEMNKLDKFSVHKPGSFRSLSSSLI